MMVNHVRWWEVWDNFSEDGRGLNANKTLGCFSSKKEADRFAVGKGNYRNNAMVTQKDVFIADDTSDMEEVIKKQKITTALSKLTAEERELLGM